MSQANTSAKQKPDLDITITRTFDAPREKVFKAWTKSRHLIHWWGPEGFTMPFHKMDIHPGGIYRCNIKAPDGEDHWLQGVYREMIEPTHLGFTHSWDDDGALTPETTVTIELTEEDGKTNMVFYQVGFDSSEEQKGHEDGWNSSFNRLEKYLKSEKDEF